MKKILSTFLFLSLAAFPLALAVQPALAAGGISLSPLISELDLESGKAYQRTIRVTNRDTVALEISAEAFDVSVEAQTHAVNFLPGVSRRNTLKSLAAWIMFSTEMPFVLEPGEQQGVDYSIVVPEAVAPANYYASLNFSYRKQGSSGGNVQVLQSIGSLCLVSVDVEQIMDAVEGREFEVSDIVLAPQEDQTEVWVHFSNNSLRYVNVKPEVLIQDGSGEVYYQKQGKSKRVFPGEQSRIEGDFPNVYLAADKEMTLRYALWDAQQQNKYFEQQIALEGLTDEVLFSAEVVFWVRVGLAVMAVMVLGGVVWYWRRRG